MDRRVVVKFHTNIANRWLFMCKRAGFTFIFTSLCSLVTLLVLLGFARAINVWRVVKIVLWSAAA